MSYKSYTLKPASLCFHSILIALPSGLLQVDGNNPDDLIYNHNTWLKPFFRTKLHTYIQHNYMYNIEYTIQHAAYIHIQDTHNTQLRIQNQ